jgi:hypothetical protein
VRIAAIFVYIPVKGHWPGHVTLFTSNAIGRRGHVTITWRSLIGWRGVVALTSYKYCSLIGCRYSGTLSTFTVLYQFWNYHNQTKKRKINHRSFSFRRLALQRTIHAYLVSANTISRTPSCVWSFPPPAFHSVHSVTLTLLTSSNFPHKTSHSASHRPRSNGSNNPTVAKDKICDPAFLFTQLRKLTQQLASARYSPKLVQNYSEIIM